MKMHGILKSWNRRIPFNGLSIQQRLPLLICFLLLCVVVALGWLSEIGVRKAAMDMAKERLGTLTAQLSSLFGQAAFLVTNATRTTAATEAVRSYITGAARNDSTVIVLLNKLRSDSSWVLVELLDTNMQVLLRSVEANKKIQLNSGHAISMVQLVNDSGTTGKLMQTGGAVYYPVIAAVTNDKIVTGYIVRWRRQSASAKSLAQFSQLLGTDANLYFGNADGSLWTDMMQPIQAPSVLIDNGNQFYDYSRSGQRVLAGTAPIPNTSWTMVIEFSQKIILETSARFIHWVITIGVFIVMTGSILAWLMSRNITRPLHQLTAAASSMAAGHYTVSVEVNRVMNWVNWHVRSMH